jgi:hypothetical protein
MAEDTNGPVVGSCEHNNEPSITIKGGIFLHQLSSYQFIKNDSVLWDLLLKKQSIYFRLNEPWEFEGSRTLCRGLF